MSLDENLLNTGRDIHSLALILIVYIVLHSVRATKWLSIGARISDLINKIVTLFTKRPNLLCILYTGFSLAITKLSHE